MISTFRKYFFLVLTAFSLSCFAQESWTLQKCIDYSLEHNIQARQADLRTNLSKSRLQQSYMEYLPSLNGNASHNYNYGKTIDQFAGRFVDQRTQTNNFYISSSVTLFNGFQLQNTRRQYKYDFLAGKKDAEQTRNDVALNVIANYLQVLFNTEFFNTAKSSTDATEKQLSRIEQLVTAGALPVGNKLEMEAQLASDELNEVNAKNRLDLSYLDLAQSMNLDSVQSLKIVNPNLSTYEYTILEVSAKDIYHVALQNQPSVKSGEFRVKSAQAGLSLARGTRSPQLTMSGSFGSGYSDARQQIAGYQKPDSALFGYISNIPIYYTPAEGEPIFEKTPFNKQINDNLNKSFGFNLTIPLFNSWQSKSAIDRAKINYSEAELNLQLTRNVLFKNIQQAHADALAALRKYNASSKNVNAMSESFKYTEQKFNLGMVNSLDFLTAKNNLDKAKSELLQAQYEYIFKTKILDFYLGKQLSF